MRRQTEKSSITADTPGPYRIADLLALIDERIGRLEGRNDKPYLRSLKVRIVPQSTIPRYHFMFSQNTNRTRSRTRLQRSSAFRATQADRHLRACRDPVRKSSTPSPPCSCPHGLRDRPSGAMAPSICWSFAKRRTAMVPADPSLGFVPTRQAISRIAKEGRKYGVSLGIITQRPGELDPTILSQCSTVFRHAARQRSHQEIIRSAIANSSISTTSFISLDRQRRGIAFGGGVAVRCACALPASTMRGCPAPTASPTRLTTTRSPSPTSVRSSAECVPSTVPTFEFPTELSGVTDQAGPALEDNNRSGRGTGTRSRTPIRADTPHSRPYSPDMLPRPVRPGNQEFERFSRIREQILSGEAERISGRPAEAPGRSDAGFATPAPRHEGSLRESLLRRPLGSLIRK